MSDPGQPMSLRAQAKHVVNHYQLTGKPLEFGGAAHQLVQPRMILVRLPGHWPDQELPRLKQNDYGFPLARR